LWVRNIPVEGERCKWIYESHIFELRRKIWICHHRSYTHNLTGILRTVCLSCECNCDDHKSISVIMSWKELYSFLSIITKLSVVIGCNSQSFSLNHTP